MFLQNLKLENFRNFENLEVDFDPEKNLTVLLGDNAQGKTNFLEAIYFLAITRSFRTKRFIDTIMWEREHGRISCRLEDKDREHNLEIGLASAPTKQKRLKKEGSVVKSSKYLHHFTVVLFVPSDVRIITGSPERKRRYLNLLAVQAFPGFLESLVTYTRALKNRNETLRMIREGNAQHEHLRVWDEKLAELGLQIWGHRKEIIDFFSQKLPKTYQKIAASEEKIELKYKIKPPTSKQEYLSNLQESYDRDLRKLATHFGPHRDNFQVTSGEHQLKEYGSRGECRTAILALKLLELEFLRKKTGKKPVLLLDDVFSELDHHRQEHLIEAVLEHQTFLTTTCREHLGHFEKGIKVLEVGEGKVKA